MIVQDVPLTQARANLHRMSMYSEQASVLPQAESMRSHVQDTIRFGEQTRDLLEEALDSIDEKRITLCAEQALNAVEETLDQANQALLASETTTRKHVELMGASIERAISLLDIASKMEAA